MLFDRGSVAELHGGGSGCRLGNVDVLPEAGVLLQADAAVEHDYLAC